jgi:GTPase SAR1 family protein
MPKQIKVMFVGDSGCGKTSVLTQGCIDEPFASKIDSTNMVDLYFKKTKVKNNQIKITVMKNKINNLIILS